VFRGPNSIPTSVGATHSMCYAAWFSSVPGLKVVAPYSSADAKGLLKAAIRDDNPVCVLESELLYGEPFPMTAQEMSKDFVLPIGKAHIEREGSDITLITFGRAVGLCLKAAETLASQGVKAEVSRLCHVFRVILLPLYQVTNVVVVVVVAVDLGDQFAYYSSFGY
jgi:pyruvate dehydrogenase E1 component beta subunit